MVSTKSTEMPFGFLHVNHGMNSESLVGSEHAGKSLIEEYADSQQLERNTKI
jgi:hypothetical protein